MLAILSLLCLQLRSSFSKRILPTPAPSKTPTTAADYFSRRATRPRELSPGWPRLPSVTPSPVLTPPMASTAISNRGSWSSLFNAGLPGRHRDGHGERHTAQQGLDSPTGIPVPGRGRPHRMSDAGVVPPKIPFPGVKGGINSVSNSWGHTRTSPKRTPVSFSSAGHGRRANGRHDGKGAATEKRISFVKMDAWYV
jgi:WD repeat-containing protein 59